MIHRKIVTASIYFIRRGCKQIDLRFPTCWRRFLNTLGALYLTVKSSQFLSIAAEELRSYPVLSKEVITKAHHSHQLLGGFFVRLVREKEHCAHGILTLRSLPVYITWAVTTCRLIQICISDRIFYKTIYNSFYSFVLQYVNFLTVFTRMYRNK